MASFLLISCGAIWALACVAKMVTEADPPARKYTFAQVAADERWLQVYFGVLRFTPMIPAIAEENARRTLEILARVENPPERLVVLASSCLGQRKHPPTLQIGTLPCYVMGGLIDLFCQQLAQVTE